MEKLTKDNETHAAMSDAELAERAEYYMGNTAGGVLGVKWLPGENVYDAVVVHTIIPEMLKRLREHHKLMKELREIATNNELQPGDRAQRILSRIT